MGEREGRERGGSRRRWEGGRVVKRKVVKWGGEMWRGRRNMVIGGGMTEWYE